MEAFTEQARTIPVRAEVDVVVAGGGPSGVNAAIAAARSGASALLVERYGYLGGMITGSNVTWYLGMGNGKSQTIRGLSEAFIARLDEVGGLTSERNSSGDCNSDAEFVKWLSVEMVQEAGADILLHSWVSSAVVVDGVCRGLIVESKSGREAILAKVVVDATADGDVCASAGVEMATDNHDITLICEVQGVDRETVEAFRRDEPDAHAGLMTRLAEQGGVVPAHGGAKFTGFSAVNVGDLTHIENEARKRAMRGLVFLRTHMPGYERARIALTCPQLGVRESRKIQGEYTITEGDILGSRKFGDTIGRCGAQMTGYKLYDVSGLDYDLPYRCLVPQRIDGLLATGRCISATHEAINTLRLIGPCMLTGEAAGTAAALAAERDVAPRDIDVAEIQSRLKQHGSNLG
ncbi:FAD-dependent oxidoreductase [bacterium]|nr:FAD-dependent oxidoreductase [bacterium]